MSPSPLAEVLERAVEAHPQLEASKQERVAAKAAAASVRTNYWGRIKVTANVMLWDDELVLAMGDSGDASSAMDLLPPPTTPYEMAFLAFVGSLSEPITLRDQLTGEFSISAMQPITPLYKVSLGAKAADVEVEVARAKEVALREQITAETATAYFRALQAQAMLDSAELSVRRLEVQRDRLRVLREGRVVSESDLLRLEVGLAAAQQEVIMALSAVALAHSYLAVNMGRSPSEPTVPSAVPEEPLEPLTITIDEAYTLALERRTELVELKERIAQARIGAEIAEADYLPDLVASGAYTHSEGMGMMGEDSLFVGLFLDWTLYEWGRIEDGVDQAHARVLQVEHTREHVQNLLRLQVKKAYLEQDSSREAYELAKMAVGLAEDAYAIETRRMESGATTGADLIDVEGALTEARNNQTAAYYNAIIARIALGQAIGAELTADSILRGALQ